MSVFRDDILKGKTALVTGGGGDICGEIAQVYAAHGANVVISSRSQERLDEAAATMREATGANILAVAGDVRDYEGVEEVVAKTVEEFGGIDIVLNGAAGNFPSPIAAMSPNGFKTVMDIDMQGTFNVTKACFPHLQAAAEKHGDASITNISATLHYTGTLFQAHVCAAKAAIDAFTRVTATEWGPLGIRANAVAPGPIGDTEGMRRLAPTDMAVETMEASIPLRRFGTKRDVADTCLFLASEGSMYTTGAIIVVDGGAWLQGMKVGDF